ncbi:MAG: hypothetical protein R3208_09280 [Ketobacteraceae bacterium]|nr:hypothetical protein [Ketobacteraceae bacterium]
MKALKLLQSSVIALSLVSLAGCASKLALTDKNGEDLVGADGVVTLVNLHPDMQKGPRLTAINWQLPALIPMCTEVKIIEANEKVATIKDKSTGVVYTYYYHKAAAEPFATHLKRYFGKSCDQATVASLSKVDQEGIKSGTIKKGMSKQGVIFAAGYPPRHATPSTSLNSWKYWKSRWDTMLITFEDDKVARIVD